jgi:hypothetical protein
MEAGGMEYPGGKIHARKFMPKILNDIIFPVLIGWHGQNYLHLAWAGFTETHPRQPVALGQSGQGMRLLRCDPDLHCLSR